MSEIFSHNNIFEVFSLSFFAFFTTLSPINCVITFITLTKGYTPLEQKMLANRSVLVASILLLTIMLFGFQLISFIGIKLFSLKIAGGILLAITSVGMVYGINKEEEGSLEVTRKDISVFPLAIPIITGPGAITTSILIFNQYAGFYFKIIVCSSLIMNLLITLILFRLSTIIGKYVKQSTLNILYRISGIILTSLAIQFIIDGIKEANIF